MAIAAFGLSLAALIGLIFGFIAVRDQNANLKDDNIRIEGELKDLQIRIDGLERK